MSKVLIAVDGSEDATRAAGRAVEILGRDHSYTILEAVRPPLPIGATSPVGGGYAIPPSPEIMLAAGEAADARARDEVATTARRIHCDADLRVEDGPAVEIIRRLVAAEGFDLVVVGSYGKGLAERIALGSVSHDLLKHPPCAVLVIPATR